MIKIDMGFFIKQYKHIRTGQATLWQKAGVSTISVRRLIMFYKAILVLVSPLVLFCAVTNAAVSKEAVRKSSEATNSDLVRRLFYQAPHIYPPAGKENQLKIFRWRNIYSERDLDYDKKIIKYKNEKGMELLTSYQHLLGGWHRMLEAGHLKMIYQECKDNDIPFEIVFLALAESAWDSQALSRAGAKGYWQFMPATAKSYGLIDDDIDYRSHAQRSTEAAIRLLKDNYNLTLAWDRVYKINGEKITNSDRWLWAFWAYNRSPKSVSQYYKKFRGNPKPFATSVDNKENANYVSKIFAIREVLKEYTQGSQGETAGSAKTTKKAKKKTLADTQYAAYKKTWYSMSLPERLESLEQIKKSYLAESVTAKKSKYPPIPATISKEIWYVKELLAEIDHDIVAEKVVKASVHERETYRD
ncbi:MAG: transglycosylase SLT domain-containing protein [Nitrospirae bacterium]|nr:transglycosylase SLT domain-containing protein [Nitrospirota bacterium]